MSRSFLRLLAGAALFACLVSSSRAADLGQTFGGAQAAVSADYAPGAVELKSVTGQMVLQELGGLTAQFDLGAHDLPKGWLAEGAAHLFAHPTDQAAIGVFALYGSVNHQPDWYAAAGIEGQFALATDVTIEARLGAGVAHPDQTRFIMAEVGLQAQVHDNWSVFGGLSAAFVPDHGTFYSAMAGLEYAPKGAPLSFRLALLHEGATGTLTPLSDTSLFAGITARFGAKPNNPRPFRTPRAVTPLYRHGLFG